MPMRSDSRPRSFSVARFRPVAIWLIVLSPVGFGASEPGADRDASSAREAFFEQKVRPLLAERCYACHGPTKQKSGLRLDSREAALQGGDGGPAVVPGKPDESPLVEAINYEGLEMPPKEKLEPASIAILTRWVAMGAPWPSTPPGASGPPRNTVLPETGPHFSPADRDFWSLRPLRPMADAEQAGAMNPGDGGAWANWPRNAIDRFLLKTLLDRGLTPAPEADRQTLIRRLTFDLTGLPPTPEEIDAFVADERPEAYERLVDRLLASPRYAQRWARHWLDLVRYAESDGYRQDAYRPAAWRYRDYVVQSFRRDKPYDRFVTEQLAGDEIDPDDLELRVATGYLRLGTYEFNQRHVRGQWSDILNDITDVTGEVFLGLGIGCARCHDHKFDPILQRDYYRLQAFFAPLLPRDDLPLLKASQAKEHARRQAAWEEATAEIRRAIAALEEPQRALAAQGAVDKFQPDIKAILSRPANERTPLEVQLAALARRQVVLEYEKEPALKGAEKTRRDALKRELARFDHLKPPPAPEVLTATDVGPEAPPTTIPGTRPTDPIAPGFLSVLDPSPARLDPPPADPGSTGRRLALARWLTRPDNPLSTRVIVNRVWQQHFGRGIVGTSSDFGRLGEPPSHPELLDWLAGWFLEEGWRLKPLHRLIVTSSAYRQSADRAEGDLQTAMRVDPENRLLWKRTVLRLDAEEIRDAMLAVSGELDRAIGGPAGELDQTRRAIDTKMFRNSRDPLLDAFDAPDGYVSTGRRTTTTTSTQALLMINGGWSLRRARALARRLESMGEGEQARVVAAYRLAFGREPTSSESARAGAFLAAQAARVSPGQSSPETESLVDFCHVLLNANEFLYVD
jgi:hypothetical protein